MFKIEVARYFGTRTCRPDNLDSLRNAILEQREHFRRQAALNEQLQVERFESVGHGASQAYFEQSGWFKRLDQAAKAAKRAPSAAVDFHHTGEF